MVVTAFGCGGKEAPVPQPTATPTATASAEPTGETGTLSNLEGDVQVLRSAFSDWVAATSGMRIGSGDGLKTGGDGYVLITFFDGSVMEVEADSEILVEELSETSGGSTTVRINQVLGNTLNRVENLVDSSSNYEVETPAGSAVVRGTIFGTQVGLYGDTHRTCINTFDQSDDENHNVTFTNNGKTVNVSESMTSCCWDGGVPFDPFYSDPADDSLPDDGGDGGGGMIICDWDGTWCTNFGQVELFRIEYPMYIGTYNYSDEGCLYQGMILGNVSGNMLTGKWGEQLIGYGECEQTRVGEFEFTMLDDCNSFTGRWRYCEPPGGEGGEVECDEDWYEGEEGWSGTRGECPIPLCRTCPDYDSELDELTYCGAESFLNDSFSIGGCRLYMIYLDGGYYRFDICGYGNASYSDGDPIMEMYRYDNCSGVGQYYNNPCDSGGKYLGFFTEDAGYYILKIYEDGDNAALSYTLVYSRGCG